MKNGYTLLTSLTSLLNNSHHIIIEILKEGKKEFSKNEKSINVALGFFSELNEITKYLDEEIYILNRRLYDLLTPLISYSNSLFNDLKLVNTYKLYDALKIDVCELRTFLNNVNI